MPGSPRASCDPGPSGGQRRWQPARPQPAPRTPRSRASPGGVGAGPAAPKAAAGGGPGAVPGLPQEARAAAPAEPVGQAPRGLASLLRRRPWGGPHPLGLGARSRRPGHGGRKLLTFARGGTNGRPWPRLPGQCKAGDKTMNRDAAGEQRAAEPGVSRVMTPHAEHRTPGTDWETEASPGKTWGRGAREPRGLRQGFLGRQGSWARGSLGAAPGPGTKAADAPTTAGSQGAEPLAAGPRSRWLIACGSH